MFLFKRFEKKFFLNKPFFLYYKGILNCHFLISSIDNILPSFNDVKNLLNIENHLFFNLIDSSQWTLYFAIFIFNEIFQSNKILFFNLIQLDLKSLQNKLLKSKIFFYINL